MTKRTISLAVVAAVFAAFLLLAPDVLFAPLFQQETVALPPALGIAVQLLFGVLFGILGLALDSPFTAAAMTIINVVYVESYLVEETDGAPEGKGR